MSLFNSIKQEKPEHFFQIGLLKLRVQFSISKFLQFSISVSGFLDIGFDKNRQNELIKTVFSLQTFNRKNIFLEN